MRLLLLFLSTLLLGCMEPRPTAVPSAPVEDKGMHEAIKRAREEEQAKAKATIDAMQARIDAATKAAADARESGDYLAELLASRKELQARAEQADLLAKEQALLASKYRGEASSLDAAIRTERDEQSRAKLYWFSGIAGAVAIVAGAVALFSPLLRRFAAPVSAIAASIAALAVFVAWLLPYLIWIGAGLALVLMIVVAYFWFNDNKTAEQVITAVEHLKGQVPGYKDHFAKYIDTGVDKNIDKIRLRKGFLRKGVIKT